MLLESLFEAEVSSAACAGAVSVGVAECELQLGLAWGSSSQRSVGTRCKFSRAVTCRLVFKVGEFRMVLGKSSELCQALVLRYY